MGFGYIFFPRSFSPRLSLSLFPPLALSLWTTWKIVARDPLGPDMLFCVFFAIVHDGKGVSTYLAGATSCVQIDVKMIERRKDCETVGQKSDGAAERRTTTHCCTDGEGMCFFVDLPLGTPNDETTTKDTTHTTVNL